jgi:hypothetical protein
MNYNTIEKIHTTYEGCLRSLVQIQIQGLPDDVKYPRMSR